MTINKQIILASNSTVRKTMLEEAGLAFRVIPSSYDEEAHKDTLAHLPPLQLAQALAQGKAQTVSNLHPESYVIGADQICALGEQIFDKPATEGRAKQHLQALQGKTHQQISAACIYHNNICIWQDTEIVTLTMRVLNDAVIAEYIATDQPLEACGAYRYEANGHTLFSHIDGSADAIKGLPLAGLLAFIKTL